MLKESDIVKIKLGPSHIKYAGANGAKASIGGISRVRDNPQERTESLGVDQLIGQLAHMAGSLHFFGNLESYKLARFYANLYPKLGDKGYDIPGCNVDFKGSKIRNKDKPLLDYNLAVRPDERHPDWIYILILIDLEPNSANANIIGWAKDSELPQNAETSGIFEGAYLIPAKQLNRIMPLKWTI